MEYSFISLQVPTETLSEGIKPRITEKQEFRFYRNIREIQFWLHNLVFSSDDQKSEPWLKKYTTETNLSAQMQSFLLRPW